ncbi:UNVERIFIED_ORG: hypothetical protein ABIB63_003904 [Xanthomonas axonopodis]
MELDIVDTSAIANSYPGSSPASACLNAYGFRVGLICLHSGIACLRRRLSVSGILTGAH